MQLPRDPRSLTEKVRTVSWYLTVKDPAMSEIDSPYNPMTWGWDLDHQSYLGGGFKYFLFSPPLGEMIQFD